MPRSQVRQVEFSPVRMAAFRAKAGLTQEALARELNVGLRSVTRWEGGSHQPTADALLALADVLDCKPDDLYVEKKS